MSEEMPSLPEHPRKPRFSRDVVIAGTCGLVVALMVGASYAAVPFYNWFCRATGFNGTPQIASTAPAHATNREITVRFDSNISGGLPWKFVPEKDEIRTRIGQVETVYYKVINQSARETTGQAGYNVTPLTAGAYFTKINCFCFTEQTMEPGETREMAVVFYVDPSMLGDSEQATTSTITLSYTFYPVKNPEPKPVAASERNGSRS
jgi:cytochrome c oxidase assembly protein subunit 11